MSLFQKIIILDESWLVFIHSLFEKNAVSHFFVSIFSDSQVVWVALFLVVYWLWGVYKKNDLYKYQSLHIFFGIFFAFFVYILLNQFLPHRPRPELLSSITPFIEHLPDNSFPSGHAIFAAAASYMFFHILGTVYWSWILFILGILMCFSRIVAGIHYPGDILVGYLVGWLLVMFFYSLLSRTGIYQKLTDICIQFASKLHL